MRTADILVVDDERVMRDALRRLLEAEGHAVRTARSGDEALALFRERRPDLVLLDVMMPRRNGFAVLAEIRAEDAALPVLFLTAMASEAAEVTGMGLGADDYILKSAAPDILLARVRRALARATAAPAPTGVLFLGRTRVDVAARTVTRPDGGAERLTGAEADILRALASDRSRYFTCAELYAAMHGAGAVAADATLRSQVSRLKAKLGAAGELIRSERGLGYRLLP